MAWRCLIAATLGVCAAGRAHGVEFPYVAYVNSSDVYVRSGPGRNYYPTDKLPKGAKVEIYRHDPGGWYAIRPPRQSFSWVSSRHLDPVDDRLAVVNSERVVARVGSAFSDVRDVIQVRLEKGEKLEFIEPPSADSPWCKVAPPAGEFRWIFSKFVDSEFSAEVAGSERDDAAEPADDETRPTRTPGADIQLASDAQAVEPKPRAAARRGERHDISTPVARERELNRIDLELSAMVIEEVTAWSFAELKQRADAVLTAAQTPAERGQARVLVDKIVRFDDIKQRQDALRRAPQEAENPAAVAGPRQVTDPRFDGVGRLAPVISQRAGAPQYALVDGTNNVVSFISPAPGVNLRPYVNQQVGVNGQRAYMNDLGRQHINVQRVTLVDVLRR
jgi:SH3-like domain-containing protein